jgi:hypothetical protein
MATARVLPALAVAALAASLRAAPTAAVEDQFFIVSSVDSGMSTMVLKEPTEVTLTVRYTGKTRCRTEHGKPCSVSDLRAGETIFLTAERNAAGGLVAISVRHGVMTLPELRRRYLSGSAKP